MDAIIMILIYAFLGLVAFTAPKFVHEAKNVLNFLDKASFLLLILFIFINAFQFKTNEMVKEISSFTMNSLIGVDALFVYLLCANISRCLWLGRCSVKRIVGYLIAIIVLTHVITIVRANLP